jgi:hypothetical protein
MANLLPPLSDDSDGDEESEPDLLPPPPPLPAPCSHQPQTDWALWTLEGESKPGVHNDKDGWDPFRDVQSPEASTDIFSKSRATLTTTDETAVSQDWTEFGTDANPFFAHSKDHRSRSSPASVLEWTSDSWFE